MQIQYICPDCFQEKIKNKDIYGILDASFSVELNDNCMMYYECPQGHKGIFVIQNPKFEVLFDLGILSYLEGYTRESVSSLIASYERFLEFSAKIFSKRLGVSYDLYKTLSEKSMRLSERQIGIYYALFLTCFHEIPTFISNKKSEFRNNVIHNGYIPTIKEVEDFGNELLSVMLPVLNRIKKNFQKELCEFTSEYIHERVSSISLEKEMKISTMCMGTSLGLYTEAEINKSFNDMSLIIEKMKNITFSKFFEQSKKENRYNVLNSLFGKYI